MALKRAAKRERHEATGVADVAAVTVRNGLRGALSGAESQLAARALATDLPGFEICTRFGIDEVHLGVRRLESLRRAGQSPARAYVRRRDTSFFGSRLQGASRRAAQFRRHGVLVHAHEA